MTIILVAIALATIAVLAYTVRRQLRSNQAMHEHSLHLANEVQALRRQLSTVTEVIDHSAGGVEKRIREQQEIVVAITARQPVLFLDEPGLKHWLNANSEFFLALKSAAAVEHL